MLFLWGFRAGRDLVHLFGVERGGFGGRVGVVGSVIMMSSSVIPAQSTDAGFGPGNPFYVPSALPFQAPPFDKIKDNDYQSAIEAGMAEQRKEIRAIADNPAAPTFENTIVAMEKTGALFQRAYAAFNAVTGANTNPVLEKVQREEAPKLAAHSDAIYLDAKLFHRVAAVHEKRESLKLSPEGLRLVEFYYQRFVEAGRSDGEDFGECAEVYGCAGTAGYDECGWRG